VFWSNRPGVKICLVVVAAALAGAAIGIAQTLWHSGWIDASRRSYVAAFEAEENDGYWALPKDHRRPRIVLDSEEYDFGVMEFGDTMRRAFTLHNRGDYPLVVAKADSSCTCTLANIAEDAIPPGGSAEVELEWTARASPTAGSRFRHWAKLQTNDPDRPLVTLTVQGDMTAPVVAHPASLTFTRLAQSQTASARINLYFYREIAGAASGASGLQVVRTELLTAKTASAFVVSPQSTVPPDVKSRRAKSGCTVEVTVRPGLPKGAFRQVIRLHTNVPGALPVDVVVTGEVGDDVRLVGPGYNERTGILDLGTFKAADGTSREFELFVYGERDPKQPVKIVGTEPQMLQITVSEPVADDAKNAVRFGLKVAVPPGAVIDGKLGVAQSGSFHIDAGPETPQLEVRVRLTAQ
jgi:hypothetical protein